MTGLELGYSITSRYEVERPVGEAVERVLHRAEVAADAGYEYVQVGDHHAADDYNYLQNVPMAARLTEVFDRVAVMFLLPLYHPVHLAEQGGTLEALVDEFDFWCAIGYNDAAFTAFGVPKAERAARFEESLALIQRLWCENAVSFDGEFYAVDEASVNPKADPRVSIGGTAESAVRRAGRSGDAWVVGAQLPLAGLQERLHWLRDAAEGDPEVIIRRDALVLDDREAAESEAQRRLANGYRGWGPEADWLLVGDPGRIAEELDILEAVGVDEVVVRPMTDDHATETLRNVARAREAA